MAAYQWVKQMVDSLQNSRQIQMLHLSMQNSSHLFKATLQLLILTHKLTLNELPINLTSVLQKITASLSHLLPFSEPCRALAHFDYKLFQELCEYNPQFNMFKNMVFGIFPPRAQGQLKCLQMQESMSGRGGNSNWMITRRVLNSWHQHHKSQMNPQQLMVSLTLLANNQLFRTCQQKGGWTKIWCYIYLWTINLILPAQSNPTWKVLNDGQLPNKIIYAREGLSEQSKLAHYLIQFIIKLALKNEESDLSLINAVRQLKSKRLEDYPRKEEYILTAQLLKFISKNRELQQTQRQCQVILRNGIKQLMKQSLSEELRYYLLHNIDTQEAIEYFNLNKDLKFWQYPLSSAVTEELAKQSIEEIHTFDQDQQFQIVTRLPFSQLLYYFLNPSPHQVLSNVHFIKIASRLSENRSKDLAQHVHRHLPDIQTQKIVDGLGNFGEQWRYWYTINLNKSITRQTFEMALSLLGFDLQSVKAVKTHFLFPQQHPAIVFNVGTLLMEFLQSNWPKISLQSQKSVYKLFLKPSFVKNLHSLQQYNLSKFWVRAGYFLLQKDVFLEDLMNIPGENGKQA